MKTLDAIVREDFGRRSVKDRRKRVKWILCSYLDTNGIEYRRAYEFPVDTSFDKIMKAIPKTID